MEAVVAVVESYAESERLVRIASGKRAASHLAISSTVTMPEAAAPRQRPGRCGSS